MKVDNMGAWFILAQKDGHFTQFLNEEPSGWRTLWKLFNFEELSAYVPSFLFKWIAKMKHKSLNCLEMEHKKFSNKRNKMMNKFYGR